ncbi:Crp/Fnr family transcriptional regulator [Chryseobacterium sp. MFBS3-17]|uniref:Crp/Fnr family transcriptional regulator n=1 Tax=Chryseobacterium sp. MFBS3-17 TaxID=2886689 RepID=UPI001D0ED53E|nr:Crp/Fnr family transcriptional regulator [Chryseobacterium sp. MFBS3-17]MCC2590865.1 Crp/Fnr family transcriptional regulator [Chryseobacterium sp. MFBS3-17]
MINPTESAAMRLIYAHFLLSEENVTAIVKAHQPVQVGKGELLLLAGQVAKEYYIVEEGLVRAFVTGLQGQEITTEFFCENEIAIVPASLFHHIPSQETVQAVTDCMLWKIDYETFQALFEQMEGLREWGRAWFAYQVFAMKQRSLDLVTETASTRYLKLLAEKPQIVRQAPLKHIASFLGITDTSLSRIRKEILGKPQ